MHSVFCIEEAVLTYHHHALQHCVRSLYSLQSVLSSHMNSMVSDNFYPQPGKKTNTKKNWLVLSTHEL